MPDNNDAGQPQRDVIAWLASPAAHGGHEVERIDTHSAIVFLAGARALKPSDADEAVVRRQLEQDVGAVGWRRVDASGDPDHVRRLALSVAAAPVRAGA